MRLIPFPRRHRILWLVALVLGVSACGSWLAATGRSPGYGSGFDTTPASSSSSAGKNAAAELRWVDQAELTGDNDEPAISAAPTEALDTIDSSHSADIYLDTEDLDLTGVVDPVAFAAAVAETVFVGDPAIEFDQRVETVMAVAALPPIGSPADLRADLAALDPSPRTGATQNDRVVSFTVDSAIRSGWGTARIDQLHLPAGSFAIDVTGHQQIHVDSQDPISVAVTAGITGACPPALTQCEVDRIFPRTIAAELGR